MKHAKKQSPSASPSARSNQPFFGATQSVQREPFFKPSGAVPPVQAKLTVGAVGDQYEQEADRVAAAVVDQIHSPSPEPAGGQQVVQRMGEEEDDLQMSPLAESIQRMGEEEEDLQMKPQVQRVGAEGGEVSGAFESAVDNARGGGQSLAPDLQTQMGQAMGADFSEVRVHADRQSDGLNRAVGARAFTTGQDLFFKRGEYQPRSRGGQELIAHELTHVVQQSRSNDLKRQGDGIPEWAIKQYKARQIEKESRKARLDLVHVNTPVRGIPEWAKQEFVYESLGKPLSEKMSRFDQANTWETSKTGPPMNAIEKGQRTLGNASADYEKTKFIPSALGSALGSVASINAGLHSSTKGGTPIFSTWKGKLNTGLRENPKKIKTFDSMKKSFVPGSEQQS